MTPQLRFPEFTDEWKIERLGQIVSFHRGGALSKDQLDNDGQYKAIHYGELFTKYNEVIKEARSKTNTNTGKISESGDLLMPTSDVTPEGLAKASAIYESGVMLGGDINVLRPNRLIDSTYLSYLINSQKKKVMRLVTGTTVRHVYASDIAKIYYGYPSLDEQQKIADFLTAVDDKISALEQKVEKLETYKRGVMQKIFARRIRFTRSDGSQYPEWETKRLDEIYSFIVTLPLSRAYLSYDYVTYKGAYKYIHYGDIHTKLPMHLDTENTDDPLPLIVKAPKIISSSYLNDKLSNSMPTCKPGDIVMADASEDYKDIGKSVEIVSTGNRTVAGLHTILLRPYKKVALGFGAYLFSSSNVRRQITRLATGVSVLGISKSNLSHVKLNLPSEEEQQKIADFLSAIDQKITLTTQQLEKTKEFKKGLLQRMFV